MPTSMEMATHFLYSSLSNLPMENPRSKPHTLCSITTKMISKPLVRSFSALCDTMMPTMKVIANEEKAGHLSAAGAFWGALRPGCAGRRSLRAYVRLCGDVAAVRSLLQKAQKSFKFLLTEPRSYGIILLAACFDSQLQTISEPNGITTCARSSGG